MAEDVKDGTVSIGIPSYNYGGYIGAAIDSVLKQTYRKLEVIVVDDCSDDDSFQIAKAKAVVDPRVRPVRNERNLGMVENWNRCLELATGEYVKILCADDLLEPQCVERCVGLFRGNRDVGLVTTARRLVDEAGMTIGCLEFEKRSMLMNGRRAIRKCFFSRNLIGEPTATMFRRSLAGRRFNPRYRQLTDLEMWFHLLEQGDLGYIHDPLCRFRMHTNQMSRKNADSLAFLADEMLLKEDYMGKEYLQATLVNECRWKFKVSFTIWSHRNIGMSRKVINREVGKIMPVRLFYSLLAVTLGVERARSSFIRHLSRYKA